MYSNKSTYETYQIASSPINISIAKHLPGLELESQILWLRRKSATRYTIKAKSDDNLNLVSA